MTDALNLQIPSPTFGGSTGGWLRSAETEEKYAIEAEYRKLEAEVGPIKYIAEFIYEEADRDILEQAVRWVIITIIFVFVCLLLVTHTNRLQKKHYRK